MLGKRLIVLVQVFCFLNVVKIHVLSNEQTDRHSEYTFVYPQKVHQKWKRQADAITEDKEERVTYSLIIGGKNHFLHLEKNKDFLAKDFVQFSYDASGKLVTSYPDVYNHCHYHGRLEGHEDSLVALSTCSGLSGVILFGNKSYGIEPVTKSTTNQHYIFPLKSKNGMDFCGVTSETDPSDGHAIHEPAMSFTGLLRKKRNLPGTRYVKMVLVVDKNRYDFKQDNMTATRMEMVSLANLMDRYYQQLNIHVALVGLVVLQTGNPFSVNGTAGQVLQDFVTWRKTNLLPQIPHDVAHLVVGRGAYPGGILGMAFEGTVCSESSGGGISVYPDNGLAYYSTIIAHELGHNLGLNHDNTRCTCNGGTCIMDAYASGSTLFSICSANDFATLILQGRGICLAIQPSPTSIITVPVCGNGIVDNGEQCDCGKPENCTNRCCDPATCQFTKGSTCAQGSCCDNCQMAVAGTPCRPSVNSCDLPEFCTGQSGSCPSDYYIMDGLSCLNNTAYCYEGRCQSYDYQCQRLFGTNAKKAPDLCFNIINGQGTQFGNCGYQGNSPIGCSVPDSLCGKVQCSNVNANFPPEGAIITVQNINGTNCVNADFNLGPDVQDPGYVKPGSSCAQDKTCLSFQCVNSSQLLPDLQCNAQTTCNGNGVCNNLGNCHCNDGWGPPWCNKAGFGGSINSGPAEIDYSLRNGLLIFFLLVVPLLIIIAVVLICVFKRDWVKLCLRKRLPNRSTNATGNEGNSHVPRGTTPQPRTQERPQQTISSYPAHIPGPQSRYEDLNYGAQQEVVTKTPHSLPTQGPGVPKPIPLRPNQLQ